MKVLNPQTVGGWCRQLGVRPRGKPKLSAFEVLSVVVGHALMPTGDLSMHAHGLLGKRVSNAALSKRRRRLPWQIFERMMDWVLGPQAHPQQHPAAFWKGMRLVGIDGTMFSARNAAGILNQLIKTASRRMEAAFAKLRVVILVELGTHHPMAAVVAAATEGELALAYRLIAKVPEQSLLLADRLFGVGTFLVAFLHRWVQTQRDFLVRVSSVPRPRRLRAYADGSVLVEIKAHHGEETLELLAREIRGVIRGRNGCRTSIRLWTSLLDPEMFPAQALLELYAMRWEQEIAFKELKVHLNGGPLLKSQTVATAMQELAALIVAQAIVARIRMQGARKLQGQVLRIRFPVVLQQVQTYWWMCEWFTDHTTDVRARRAASKMFDYLVQHATPPRRARSCPRAVRQPVTGWPRLLRNQSLTGEIHCEVIRHKCSKG